MCFAYTHAQMHAHTHTRTHTHTHTHAHLQMRQHLSHRPLLPALLLFLSLFAPSLCGSELLKAPADFNSACVSSHSGQVPTDQMVLLDSNYYISLSLPPGGGLAGWSSEMVCSIAQLSLVETHMFAIVCSAVLEFVPFFLGIRWFAIFL